MAAVSPDENDKYIKEEEEEKEEKEGEEEEKEDESEDEEEEKEDEEEEDDEEDDDDDEPYYLVPNSDSDPETEPEIPIGDFAAPGEWEAKYLKKVIEKRKKLPPTTKPTTMVTVTVVDEFEVEVPAEVVEVQGKGEGESVSEKEEKTTKTFIKRAKIKIPFEYYLDLVVAYNDWKPKPNQESISSFWHY